MPRWLLVLFALCVPAGLVFLYAVPPVDSPFYPRCFFNMTTGMHCPGCGLTRCLHALLHGDILQALAYNALAVVLILPLLLVETVRLTIPVFTKKPLARARYSTLFFRLLLVLFVAYWIVRNIPVHPFTLLAPHELTDTTVEVLTP
jgi:hypothetical protein